MKIVDIADEVHRELGSLDTLSIPAIAYWLRSNIGAMNNHINTSFEIHVDTFEIVDAGGRQITPYETAILKDMYIIHHCDALLRSTLSSASTDAVVELSSDGSTIRKINKNDQAKTYLTLRTDLHKELMTMIANYKNRDVQPLQVAGDDDQSPTDIPVRNFSRLR